VCYQSNSASKSATYSLGSGEWCLARNASARLLELLNSNAFSVETFGVDGTGERTLATVQIETLATSLSKSDWLGAGQTGKSGGAASGQID
jgi:hypothetical protein